MQPTPTLVAFAAMSGVVLNFRRAIAIAILTLVYESSHWLWSVELFPQRHRIHLGALMGIGTLLLVAFASIRPGFSQSPWGMGRCFGNTFPSIV